MSLNVNRQVQDAFYRYKMPRLQAKVEGKGNGVKTVIPNMVDIARSLGRPPTCKWNHILYRVFNMDLPFSRHILWAFLSNSERSITDKDLLFVICLIICLDRIWSIYIGHGHNFKNGAIWGRFETLWYKMMIEMYSSHC